jgi:tetratricopeptide (TPR) repeat protein
MRARTFLSLIVLLGCVTATPAFADQYASGVRCYSAKDYARAARFFEAAIRANPGNSNALYYDALCYQQLGQPERARALYQFLLNVHPGSPAAANARRALAALGSSNSPNVPAAAPAAAAPQPAPPVESAPSEEAVIDGEINQARSLADAGRQSEAERQLIDAERRAEYLGSLHPKLAAVLGQLGDLYTAGGDTTRACKLYKRELQINERLLGRNSPALADRMTVQANAFSKDGDNAQAELLLRRSMDIYQTAVNSDERNHLNSKPDSDKLVNAMASLANVLRLSGRAGEAKMLDGQVRMMTVP